MGGSTVGIDRESEIPDPPLSCDAWGDTQCECEEHDQQSQERRGERGDDQEDAEHDRRRQVPV